MLVSGWGGHSQLAATTKSITESASVKQESGAVTGCVYGYLVFYPLPLLLTVKMSTFH